MSAPEIKTAEILAPAGSYESLLAAVRCGANAVYLGGKSFNARKNAANFDDDGLSQAVKYCHARDVKVYLTLNTLLFDGELDDMAKTVESACNIGVDALIVQDLSVVSLVRRHAPSMPIHASTQMSIHSLSGVKALERLGFSRVVLARELSCLELSEIKRYSDIELECFVHGALCMSVSGQCYFSAMLGGRSGNRGLCAQPCRLPASNGENEYSLSLKDLSLVGKIPDMIKAGVSSLKIEGRMKRPEYVAAAVTAVRQSLAGEAADIGTLKAVFSRDGFTSGYFDDRRGPSMFGTRRRDDVVAANSALLNGLAATYKNEVQSVPVTLSLALKRGEKAALTASDRRGNSVTVTGDVPQEARTAPTTLEKAGSALSKTGGTPFLVSDVKADIDDGLMLPASALNALRRDALDALMKLRESPIPHEFDKNPRCRHGDVCVENPQETDLEDGNPDTKYVTILSQACEADESGTTPVGASTEMPPYVSRPRKTGENEKPGLRIRIGKAEQLTPEICGAAELIIIPALELTRLDERILRDYAHKLAVDAPRILFGRGQYEKLAAILESARKNGINHAVAGNIGMISVLRGLGFEAHGDFSLNITNTPSLLEYARLGLCDATLSFELTKKQVLAIGENLPRGILAYGFLPLMLTRNCPAGSCKGCDSPALTDRRGNKLPVRCSFEVSEVLNCVPLFLADKQNEFSPLDFFTLYFTIESPKQCAEILRLYQTGEKLDSPKTRGLYFRGVE